MRYTQASFDELRDLLESLRCVDLITIYTCLHENLSGAV